MNRTRNGCTCTGSTGRFTAMSDIIAGEKKKGKMVCEKEHWQHESENCCQNTDRGWIGKCKQESVGTVGRLKKKEKNLSHNLVGCVSLRRHVCSSSSDRTCLTYIVRKQELADINTDTDWRLNRKRSHRSVVFGYSRVLREHRSFVLHVIYSYSRSSAKESQCVTRSHET